MHIMAASLHHGSKLAFLEVHAGERLAARSHGSSSSSLLLSSTRVE